MRCGGQRRGACVRAAERVPVRRMVRGALVCVLCAALTVGGICCTRANPSRAVAGRYAYTAPEPQRWLTATPEQLALLPAAEQGGLALVPVALYLSSGHTASLLVQTCSVPQEQAPSLVLPQYFDALQASLSAQGAVRAAPLESGTALSVYQIVTVLEQGGMINQKIFYYTDAVPQALVIDTVFSPQDMAAVQGDIAAVLDSVALASRF